MSQGTYVFKHLNTLSGKKNVNFKFKEYKGYFLEVSTVLSPTKYRVTSEVQN